jgi:type I restriction enzyme, S subunit
MSKAIPKLRFIEFKDTWHKLTLENFLISYRLGGNYENSESDSGIPLIKMGNLGRGNIVLDKIQYVSSSEVLDEKDQIKYGDLFFNTRNTLDLVGKVAIWRNELQLAYYNSNLMYLEFKDNFFMNYRLNSYQGIKSLRRLATGTTSVAAIYTKDLLKVRLSIPTLLEQQKIATFLSAVDEKIQQLTRKKELLEQYKKGVMQQLFSGKLRFNDENGKAYPKWEKHRLIDIADRNVKWSFTGGPFGSNLKSEEYTDSGVRILQLQNIGDGIFNDEYKIYTSEEKADALISCNIYPGEILISKMGDPVARACRVPDGDRRYLMASDGIRFVPDSSRFSDDFIFQSINHPIFRNKALSLSTGSTRKRIGLTELKEILFNVPVLEEQQKIASYLTAIDTKIESVATQITQTQTFKKGLLQQMFV